MVPFTVMYVYTPMPTCTHVESEGGRRTNAQVVKDRGWGVEFYMLCTV